MSTLQSSPGSNGNGHNPPPPAFDGDIERLHYDVERLKNRADTQDLAAGAILPFLARIEAQGKTTALEVSSMNVRLSRIEKSPVTQDDIRDVRRKMRNLETEVNRKQVQLDAAMARDRQDSQHDLDDTKRQAVMSAEQAAEKIAKAEAKREADQVRIENLTHRAGDVKEQRDEAKNDGKWLTRFLADKGVTMLYLAFGAGIMFVLQRAFGH